MDKIKYNEKHEAYEITYNVWGKPTLVLFFTDDQQEILDNLSDAKTVVQGIGSNLDEHIKIADSFSFTIDKTTVTLRDIEIADHGIHGAENSGICALLGADILEGTCWTCDFKSGYFEIKRL